MKSVLNLFNYILRHKLFKNTFAYTFFDVARSAIPFLLLPVLTRYLTPSDYGIVAIFQVLLPMMVVFVGLNMYGAVAVNFFKIEKQKIKIYIGNVIFILLASFVLTFAIIYIFKNPLANLIKFPDNWLVLLPAIALFQSVFTVAITIWQVEQKPLPYGILQILNTILNVGLSLFFIVVLNLGWEGMLLGTAITSVVFGIISIVLLCKKQYVKLSFNKNYVKDASFYGISLIPNSLGGWIMTGIDRFFISSMVGIAAVGIYTVGYQVGMIISLLAASFNRAWVPFLFEKLKENNYSAKIKIVKFTYLYNMGIIILALFLGFIAPYFLKIFVTASFYSTYKYVIWVALGYAFMGMHHMVANYIFYVKKTYILAWITFFSACVNIVLTYIFIKVNGPIGAAQATTVTFFVSFVLTWILSARVYSMPWFKIKKIIQ